LLTKVLKEDCNEPVNESEVLDVSPNILLRLLELLPSVVINCWMLCWRLKVALDLSNVTGVGVDEADDPFDDCPNADDKSCEIFPLLEESELLDEPSSIENRSEVVELLAFKPGSALSSCCVKAEEDCCPLVESKLVKSMLGFICDNACVMAAFNALVLLVADVDAPAAVTLDEVSPTSDVESDDVTVFVVDEPNVLTD